LTFKNIGGPGLLDLLFTINFFEFIDLKVNGEFVILCILKVFFQFKEFFVASLAPLNQMYGFDLIKCY